MFLENDKCSVELKIDECYSLASTDNVNSYDYLINIGDLNNSDFYKTLGIRVNLFASEYSIMAIGSGYISDYQCAYLEDYKLVVLLDYYIFSYDLNDRCIISSKEIECLGCNYELHKVVGGYIVVGEIEIIKLDENFNKIWSFSGRDIFASQHRKESVKLEDKKICLYDWLDNYYEIDYSGKVLVDRQSSN